MELQTQPFIKRLKRTKLDILLDLISRITVEMYNKGIVIVPLEAIKPIYGFRRKVKQHLTIWNLMEIAYYAIKNSTDHRDDEPILYDLLELHNEYIGFQDHLTKELEEDIKKSRDAFYYAYMYGLGNKQLYYQKIFTKPELKYHLLRYYLMLVEIPTNFTELKTPDIDCKDITGLDIKTFCRLIEAMVLYNIKVKNTLNDEDLNYIIKNIKGEHKDYTIENLIKVRDYFVGDYSFYRKDHPTHNPFIFKPIIKTKTNKYIVSCFHIWFQKIIEGIYWIIRDYYMNQQSEFFTERFGNYFEEYTRMLLDFYLPANMYKRIEVEKKDGIKRADWVIYTERYILIIEQKSGLMPIEFKEENINLAGLENYLLRTYMRGIQQLNSTETDFKKTDKKIVKLLLHFEYLNFGEGIIKDLLKKVSLKNGILDEESFKNLFFIEINEFERLIQILSEDENIFDNIIEKKFELNKMNNITVGKEFYIPIQEFYHKKEVVFLEKMFNRYEDFIKLNN